jgi:outer membrane lipoprotein-sorting protein
LRVFDWFGGDGAGLATRDAFQGVVLRDCLKMKFAHCINSTVSRRFALTLATAATVALTGCLSVLTRNRAVTKTVLASNVLDATLEQLNSQLDTQYKAIQTINATVEIQASVGGGHQGEVKDYPAFTGYILFRKPSDLRTLMLAPIVKTRAVDMVSDGKNFKLLIPTQKKAIEGEDHEVGTPSKNGLENLRPYIIRDALLIPPVSPEESVSKTENERILPPAPGKKFSTEEPDYDLTVTRRKQANELETVRVIHISRVTLKPYEQDVYDGKGRLVTIVTYDRYQKNGDVDFPMSILITRPLDEYSLHIDITKLFLNQKLDDEQFVLTFPEGMAVTKM